MLKLVRTEKPRNSRNGRLETAQVVDQRYASDALEAIRKATQVLASLPEDQSFRTQFTILEV